MKNYKLTVLSSNKFNDYNLLCQELGKLPKPSVIIGGATKGADEMSEKWAEDMGVNTELIPALWYPDGEGSQIDKGAGLKRMAKIAESSDALLAFWDGESVGTAKNINTFVMKSKFVRIVYYSIPKENIENENIFGFQDSNRWLSNVWPSEFIMNGIRFSSVENALQASKFIGNINLVKMVAVMPALEARKVGRNNPIVNADYEANKLKYMKAFLRKKFENPCLRQKLINTGSGYLEETNTWQDDFWGKYTKNGLNHLGNLLMEVREEILKNNGK